MQAKAREGCREAGGGGRGQATSYLPALPYLEDSPRCVWEGRAAPCRFGPPAFGAGRTGVAGGLGASRWRRAVLKCEGWSRGPAWRLVRGLAKTVRGSGRGRGREGCRAAGRGPCFCEVEVLLWR